MPDMIPAHVNQTDLIESWKREEGQPFAGWDFSYLDGRMLEDQAPWSYSTRAAELMRQASSVVDLGTGGGERFLKLRPHWPKKVAATEDCAAQFQVGDRAPGASGREGGQGSIDGRRPAAIRRG